MQYFTSMLYVCPKRLFLRKRISVLSPHGLCAFFKLLFIAALVLLFSGDILKANDITLPTRIASSVPEQSEFTFSENVSSLVAKLNYDKSVFAITTFNPENWLKRSKNNLSYKFGSTRTSTMSESQYKHDVTLHVRKPRDLAITATPSYFKSQNSHSSVFQEHYEEHYASLVPILNTTSSISNSIPVSTVKG